MGYMLTALFPVWSRAVLLFVAWSVCDVVPVARPRVPFSGAVARARHVDATWHYAPVWWRCVRSLGACALGSPPVVCASGCVAVLPAVTEVG